MPTLLPPGRPDGTALTGAALLAAIAAAFFLAGAVKGVSGLGLPTVAIGLLGLVMPPAAAAALLIAPSLATNLVQCLGPHTRRIAAALWPMWAGILLASIWTPLPSIATGAAGVRIGLGVILVLYGLYGLARPQLTLRLAGPPLLAVSLLTGLATGVLTAATGIFIFPMLVFLQALGWKKDEMIQALGLSFTVCTVALAISVGWGASLGTWTTAPGWVALLAAFAGLALGSRIRSRIDAEQFKKVLFCMFGVLGLAMVARGLAA